jgi:exopolyphosphatase/guanosine-5'-triphosphate,3'-diphosphate pyrophosphatase
MSAVVVPSLPITKTKSLSIKNLLISDIRILNNLVKEESWEEMRSEIKNEIFGKKPIVAIGSEEISTKYFR